MCGSSHRDDAGRWLSDNESVGYMRLLFTNIWTCFVLFSVLTTSEAQELPIRVIRHVAMYTDFEAILCGESSNTDPEALLSAGRAGFEAVDALEKRISNWKPDSYTSLANKKAADAPVEVSGDLIEILDDARKIYTTTDGAFDVTVGPLIQFWKEREKGGMFPRSEELKPVLEHIGLKYVIVDTKAQTVFFERDGIQLDFGGIAKGLALDRMANILTENGVKTARLNAGSSTIVAMGAPPGEEGWTVDILSPYNTADLTPVATVKIRDEALSTSSDTVRHIDIGGKRYSHIYNPHTGMPASGIASATVITPSGVESDALSTAFFVMGVEAAHAYCQAHPSVRAILVQDKGEGSEPIFINFTKENKRSGDEH